MNHVDLHAHTAVFSPCGTNFLALAGRACRGVVVFHSVHIFYPGLLRWVSGAKTPEETRRQLETWVPLEVRSSFTLDVVGFGQWTRVSHGVWVPRFLEFTRDQFGGEDSKEYQSAVFMVTKLLDGDEGRQHRYE